MPARDRKPLYRHIHVALLRAAGVARVSTGWLADIIGRAERCPDLVERLDVVVTDLAVRRGGRLEVPQGPNRVTIRHTPAVEAVDDLAAIPIRFGTLADALVEQF